MASIVEHHTHLPASVVAIVAGLLGLVVDWFVGVPLVGWEWAIAIGLVCTAMLVLGFARLVTE